ncbi:beta-propeller domain-containing protein [Aurantiacibacter sp. D1-12]|uniref:beta-propeller domain-containing protein n=1 Tax=Aurantiacibacter sp. D1-12 TaxID=2993658 RepID=UPI00237D2418|nr:beta-propeller domain-containing protein [Aurantiacibacter sp. D1-12]MDE1466597.1 beta-propeller domain-containing protein [Aurantiacibacter sp. D1-12]
MRAYGIALTIFGGLTPALAAAQDDTRPSWEHPRVEALTWPELDTFDSEREFRAWVREVRRLQRRLRNERRAEVLGDNIVVAQLALERQECDPEVEECIEEEDDSGARIIVTGARIQAPSYNSITPIAVTSSDGSITNNQVAAVDEGDIVKRIGDYLLVLQDGRIFAANFRDMALTDRIDVYRTDEDGEPIGADWYDEMLVYGDHIIITAYSYEDEASELSVFRLDQSDGSLERRGVFLISSEDYYDTSNYATRVVGDRLVIQTSYEAEDMVNRRNRPAVRRWVPGEEFAEPESSRPILNARDIYRPAFPISEPYVHTVSVCDLDSIGDNNLGCSATGFVGNYDSELFVSQQNIYLWSYALSDQDFDNYFDCAANFGDSPPPGAVYRLPLGRGEPDLFPTRGWIPSQFAMQEADGRFQAMLAWTGEECPDDYEEGVPITVELINSPMTAFRDSYRPVLDGLLTPLPGLPVDTQQIRFTRDWLVYGPMTNLGRPPRVAEQGVQFGYLNAVPLDDVENPQRLELSHDLTRLESLGNAMVATGYRDQSGLNVTMVDLRGGAAVRGSTLLKNRFESEGRSHAFNAMPYPEGNGLMGLPTVRAAEDGRRYPWRSDDSQLSFLSFDNDGQLADLGAVDPAEVDPELVEESLDGQTTYPNGYTCEVSCVDWYGNARPIFINRGVYALMGTEIVEAEVREGQIEVVRRLDLTGD